MGTSRVIVQDCRAIFIQSIEFGRLIIYEGDLEEALAICGNPKAQAGYPVALLAFKMRNSGFDWCSQPTWYASYSTSLCLQCFGNRAQLPRSSGKEIENTRIEDVASGAIMTTP